LARLAIVLVVIAATVGIVRHHVLRLVDGKAHALKRGRDVLRRFPLVARANEVDTRAVPELAILNNRLDARRA
jgi:L-cystine uptake protein TcyP (sodium:dicarboxylate symporter family)